MPQKLQKHKKAMAKRDSTFLLNVIHSMADINAVYAACVCTCVYVVKDTNTDMHKDLKCSNFYERIMYRIAALT